MSGESKHSPRRLNAKERALLALELRKGGASYRAIAENAEVGVKTPSGAFRLIQRALKLTLQEPADDVRRIELERLDRLQLAHWTPAKRGDPTATARVLEIMRMRARLLGLEAPVKLDHTVKYEVEWDALTKEELERIAAGASPSEVAPTKCRPTIGP